MLYQPRFIKQTITAKLDSPSELTLKPLTGRFLVVDSEGNRQVEGQLGVLLYEEVPAITKTTTKTTTTTTTTLPGTLCDDRFSQNSAVAICKLMGYVLIGNGCFVTFVRIRRQTKNKFCN